MFEQQTGLRKNVIAGRHSKAAGQEDSIGKEVFPPGRAVVTAPNTMQPASAFHPALPVEHHPACGMPHLIPAASLPTQLTCGTRRASLKLATLSSMLAVPTGLRSAAKRKDMERIGGACVGESGSENTRCPRTQIRPAST